MIYSMKEVALKTRVPVHTLQSYEKAGLLPAVKRDARGNRLYDEEHLEHIDFLLTLLSTGMPMDEVKQYADLDRRGDSTIQERKQVMLDHKAKVEKQMMQYFKYMEKINKMLEAYDTPEQQTEMLPDQRENHKLPKLP